MERDFTGWMSSLPVKKSCHPHTSDTHSLVSSFLHPPPNYLQKWHSSLDAWHNYPYDPHSHSKNLCKDIRATTCLKSASNLNAPPPVAHMLVAKLGKFLAFAMSMKACISLVGNRMKWKVPWRPPNLDKLDRNKWQKINLRETNWQLTVFLLSNTHTHPFNGPFSGTTRVSRYQKGKTNLDFTEARDSGLQWHQLGHMQVCT